MKIQPIEDFYNRETFPCRHLSEMQNDLPMRKQETRNVTVLCTRDCDYCLTGDYVIGMHDVNLR